MAMYTVHIDQLLSRSLTYFDVSQALAHTNEGGHAYAINAIEKIAIFAERKI